MSPPHVRRSVPLLRVICELPNNESAAAVALTANSSGAVSVETVALLTPEEVDDAAGRSVEYTPPGG